MLRPLVLTRAQICPVIYITFLNDRVQDHQRALGEINERNNAVGYAAGLQEKVARQGIWRWCCGGCGKPSGRGRRRKKKKKKRKRKKMNNNKKKNNGRKSEEEGEEEREEPCNFMHEEILAYQKSLEKWGCDSIKMAERFMEDVADNIGIWDSTKCFENYASTNCASIFRKVRATSVFHDAVRSAEGEEEDEDEGEYEDAVARREESLSQIMARKALAKVVAESLSFEEIEQHKRNARRDR